MTTTEQQQRERKEWIQSHSTPERLEQFLASQAAAPVLFHLTQRQWEKFQRDGVADAPKPRVVK